MGLFKGRDTEGGAKTQIYMGGSSTIMGFARQATRRGRVVAVSVGVGTVIVGVTALGIVKYLEADAATRVVVSYSSLTHCLLGEPPTENVPASVRFRSIQLTSLTQNEIVRTSDPAGAWPERCGKFVHGLSEALAASSIGDKKGKSLLEASKVLAQTFEQKESFWHDLSGPIDRVFSEALLAGIVLKPTPEVPAPPATSTAMTLDVLSKIGAFTDRAVAVSDVHEERGGGSAVRFVIDDRHGNVRRFCSVTASAASCDSLPAEIAAGKAEIRLLGSTDDAGKPFLFVGDGVFTTSGKNLVPHGAFASYAGASGRNALLLEGAREPVLRRYTGEQHEESPLGLGSLKLRDVQRDARLLWGDVVALASDGKELVLATSSLGASGAPRLLSIGVLSKASSLDNGPSREPRVDGCHVGDLTVVRAHVGRDAFLSWKTGRTWSAPLKAPVAEGLLHCQQNMALTTRLENWTPTAQLSAKLMMRRCSMTACTTQELGLASLFAGEVNLASSTEPVVGAIDGKFVVVWNAGQRGGLRLRVGEFASLQKTPDVIVYDDWMKDGRAIESSTLLDLKLMSAEKFAVLLLATPDGLRALRIGSDGSATPLLL